LGFFLLPVPLAGFAENGALEPIALRIKAVVFLFEQSLASLG
jgi:hypothetical protein